MEVGIYWFQIARLLTGLLLLATAGWLVWHKHYKLGGVLGVAIVLVAVYNPFRLQVYDQSERKIRSFDKPAEQVEIERHELDEYRPSDNQEEIKRITGE